MAGLYTTNWHCQLKAPTILVFSGSFSFSLFVTEQFDCICHQFQQEKIYIIHMEKIGKGQDTRDELASKVRGTAHWGCTLIKSTWPRFTSHWFHIYKNTKYETTTRTVNLQRRCGVGRHIYDKASNIFHLSDHEQSGVSLQVEWRDVVSMPRLQQYRSKLGQTLSTADCGVHEMLKQAHQGDRPPSRPLIPLPMEVLVADT